MRDKVWLEEGKKGMPMVGGRSSYKDWERADVRASTAPKDQPTPFHQFPPCLEGEVAATDRSQPIRARRSEKD